MKKKWMLAAGLLAAPLLLTGCQEDGAGLTEVPDGSVEASSLTALMTDLADPESEATLGCAEVLACFDADGDGLLSETERQAARAARRAEVLERFDADGDGALSETEHQAAREAKRREFMARFDEDGDGRFSYQERGRIGRHHPGFGGRVGHHGVGPEVRRRAFLEHFDSDGDGALGDAELAAIRAEYAGPQAG